MNNNDNNNSKPNPNPDTQQYHLRAQGFNIVDVSPTHKQKLYFFSLHDEDGNMLVDEIGDHKVPIIIASAPLNIQLDQGQPSKPMIDTSPATPQSIIGEIRDRERFRRRS